MQRKNTQQSVMSCKGQNGMKGETEMGKEAAKEKTTE